MPYHVLTVTPTKHEVRNQSGQKVAESPTREAADESAKVLNEAEQKKEARQEK